MGNVCLRETSTLVQDYLGSILDDITVERAVFGLFFSGVKLGNGKDGLCFTPIKEIPEAVCCPSSAKAMPLSGKLIGRSVVEYLSDMDNRTLKGKELEHYAPSEDAPKYFPVADLLVITGVTVLNDTLPNLLKMVKPGAQVIVTGPTASMLPDAYFKRGTTLMGGVLVTKPNEVLDIISEGGSGYHFFGKNAERLVISKR